MPSSGVSLSRSATAPRDRRGWRVGEQAFRRLAHRPAGEAEPEAVDGPGTGIDRGDDVAVPARECVVPGAIGAIHAGRTVCRSHPGAHPEAACRPPAGGLADREDGDGLTAVEGDRGAGRAIRVDEEPGAKPAVAAAHVVRAPGELDGARRIAELNVGEA